MRVIIKQDIESVAKTAARYVVEKINNFAPNREKPFVLGLPTGSTPLGMYQELIKLNHTGEVSFENVVTFNMDEYIGLKPSDPQSYHYFMQENFFQHIDIKPQNTHILNGLVRDYEEECLRYEEAIRAVGGINLFIGGVGTDGHIAFNEPFSSLQSRTRIKTLTQDTIKANARFFDNDISRVPTHALTVGVGTIMDANEVLILVTGKNKATALHHGIEGAVSHVWTISALQMHPHGVIICDKEATAELSPQTIEYFLDIEKNQKEE